jgi:hypothetical protein
VNNPPRRVEERTCLLSAGRRRGRTTRGTAQARLAVDEKRPLIFAPNIHGVETHQDDNGILKITELFFVHAQNRY